MFLLYCIAGMWVPLLVIFNKNILNIIARTKINDIDDLILLETLSKER